MKQCFKIAVVGSGAIGCFYGAMLARNGNDVRFLARSDYAVLLSNGLTVKNEGNTFTIKPCQAYNTTKDIGRCDLVIIALKSTANKSIPALLAPLLTDATVIMTMQNGLGNVEWLARHFPKNPIIGCLCFICSNRIEHARIEVSHSGHVALGEYNPQAKPHVTTIQTLLSDSGIKAKCEPLEEALWKKLCWNIPFNGLAIAGGGITTDKILASETLTQYARALMLETQAAAKAYGIIIPDSFLEEQITRTMPMGAYKPSSMIDFVNKKAVEIEPIWGEPLRRGMQKQVSMPHLQSLYWLLKYLSTSC